MNFSLPEFVAVMLLLTLTGCTSIGDIVVKTPTAVSTAKTTQQKHHLVHHRPPYSPP